MLVLSRHRDQSVVFPQCGITVRIIHVSRQRARIGIEAPENVQILRGELFQSVECSEALGSEPASDPSPESSRRLPVHSESAEANAPVSFPAAADPTVASVGRNNSNHSQGAADARQPNAISLGDVRLQRHVWIAKQVVDDLVGHHIDPQDQAAADLVHHLRGTLRSIDSDAARFHEREPVLPPANQKRALLVDDNPNEAKLLAAFLRSRDFAVTLASDGQAAINFLEENERPDVVLLDMVMPGMGGAETIRHIRDSMSHQDLTVFGVSGGNPDDYGVSVDPQGVDGWFRKPVDPESLVEKLNREVKPVSLNGPETHVLVGEGTHD